MIMILIKGYDFDLEKYVCTKQKFKQYKLPKVCLK